MAFPRFFFSSSVLLLSLTVIVSADYGHVPKPDSSYGSTPKMENTDYSQSKPYVVTPNNDYGPKPTPDVAQPEDGYKYSPKSKPETTKSDYGDSPKPKPDTNKRENDYNPQPKYDPTKPEGQYSPKPKSDTTKPDDGYKHNSESKPDAVKPDYGYAPTPKPDITKPENDYTPNPKYDTAKPEGGYNSKPKPDDTYILKSEITVPKPRYGYIPKLDTVKPDYRYVPKLENPLGRGIEGLVLCKSGSSYVPIEGAVARIICSALDKNGYETKPFSCLTGPTDAKGYFFKLISGLGFDYNIKLKDCKVKLEKSPLETCNVPTDVNKGISGALFSAYHILHDKKIKLYSVGPFFYTPQATSTPTTGY